MFNTSAKIPAEMIELTQWVVWQFVQRTKKPDKPDKPLFDAKTRPLRLASSTNPATWSTYEQAVSRTNDTTGLGFVLLPPFIGIDLDHCLKEGVLDVRAREVLAKFPQTYAERSPSEYVHLIVKGAYPPEMGHKFGHKEMGTVEMYTEGRYFTVTGNTIAGAPSQVQYVSKEELLWVASKFTPKTAKKSRPGSQHSTFVEGPDADTEPLRKNSPLYAALCAVNLNWEATWNGARKPDGPKGDMSESAVDMALARMAFLEGVDDQDILRLLNGRRMDQGLPPKHHGALVLTIEKAHQEFAETEQDKILDNPESLAPTDTLALAKKYLRLPLARLVKLGKSPATFQAYLVSGDRCDLGNFKTFQSFEMWRELVYDETRHVLKIDKKKWAQVCNLLLALCEYEESDETSRAGETQAWLSGYFREYMRREADYDTLASDKPFIDEKGYHLQLDDFHTHLGIQHVQVKRELLGSRLKVLGWSSVTVTRSNEKKSTITKRYWYKSA